MKNYSRTCTARAGGCDNKIHLVSQGSGLFWLKLKDWNKLIMKIEALVSTLD